MAVRNEELLVHRRDPAGLGGAGRALSSVLDARHLRPYALGALSAPRYNLPQALGYARDINPAARRAVKTLL